MAKANKRALSNQKQHRLCNDYKIPIRDRKNFNHHNTDKWVNKKRYDKYLKWKEDHK